MATKETVELILQAIDYYVENALCPSDKRPSVDVMRQIIKFEDIKISLSGGKKED